MPDRCRNWAASGTCRYGENCHFLHVPSTASTHPPHTVNVPCRNWAASRICSHGDSCRFLHEPNHATIGSSAEHPSTYALTDRSVITDRLSDHGWPLFNTSAGPILSANLMCSGENHDPRQANSFKQHPREWASRYQGLVSALVRNADEAKARYNRFPTIVVQEFPRCNSHFNIQASLLHTLLLSAFLETDGWSILFGLKDDSQHDFSQMCVIVPPGPMRRELKLPSQAAQFCSGGQYGASRFQLVQIDRFAVMNVHPGPAGNVSQIVGEAAIQLLLKDNVDVVHVVGDWNRPAHMAIPALEHAYMIKWSEVQSSPPGSHLVGASTQTFDRSGMPTVFSQSAFDLHVSISPGPDLHCARTTNEFESCSIQ